MSVLRQRAASLIVAMLTGCSASTGLLTGTGTDASVAVDVPSSSPCAQLSIGAGNVITAVGEPAELNAAAADADESQVWVAWQQGNNDGTFGWYVLPVGFDGTRIEGGGAIGMGSRSVGEITVATNGDDTAAAFTDLMNGCTFSTLEESGIIYSGMTTEFAATVCGSVAATPTGWSLVDFSDTALSLLPISPAGVAGTEVLLTPQPSAFFTRAVSGDGSFYAVWEGTQESCENCQVALTTERFTAEGAPLGTAHVLVDDSSFGFLQENFAAERLAIVTTANAALVAWTVGNGLDPMAGVIQLQVLDTTGAPVGVASTVGTPTGLALTALGLAQLPDGNVLLAWMVNNDTGTSGTVFVEPLSPTGTPLSAAVQAATFALGDGLRLVPTPTGALLVYQAEVNGMVPITAVPIICAP